MSEIKIIRIAQVEAKVGLKKSAIYKRMKEKEFPPQIKLGRHASGWLESDIDEWILKMAGKVPANDEQKQQAA